MTLLGMDANEIGAWIARAKVGTLLPAEEVALKLADRLSLAEREHIGKLSSGSQARPQRNAEAER